MSQCYRTTVHVCLLNRIAHLKQPRHRHRCKRFVNFYQINVRQFYTGFFYRMLSCRNWRGEHPDGIRRTYAHVHDARAGCEVITLQCRL